MTWPDSEINAIESREELSRFLIHLSEKIGDGSTLLENRSSERVVDAAARWIADMDGYYQNIGVEMPQSPTWAMIADIFYAAMIYE